MSTLDDLALDRKYLRRTAPAARLDKWGTPIRHRPASDFYHDYGPDKKDTPERRALAERIKACMGEMENTLALQNEHPDEFHPLIRPR